MLECLGRSALMFCFFLPFTRAAVAQDKPSTTQAPLSLSTTSITSTTQMSPSTTALSVKPTKPVEASTKGGVQSKLTRAEANKEYIEKLRAFYQLDAATLAKIETVFSGSPVMGQGYPGTSTRAMSREECQKKWESRGKSYENKEHEAICSAKNMAPLYDPQKSKASEAKVCIDKFEFPNIPCEYPQVWTEPREAAQICEALGKRLCDAHEWEGACEGSLFDADYTFDAKGQKRGAAEIRRMRLEHNQKFSKNKTWAYGLKYEKGKCATGSFKHSDCDGGSFQKCGSNTYPAGSFPECKSSLDVYDSHGNAAEIMNIPSHPDELAQNGLTGRGHTELKGSWFIFDRYQAHDDWCRWRAPYWHGDLTHKSNHHMYHLGFRCCKSLK